MLILSIQRNPGKTLDFQTAHSSANSYQLVCLNLNYLASALSLVPSYSNVKTHKLEFYLVLKQKY